MCSSWQGILRCSGQGWQVDPYPSWSWRLVDPSRWNLSSILFRWSQGWNFLPSPLWRSWSLPDQLSRKDSSTWWVKTNGTTNSRITIRPTCQLNWCTVTFIFWIKLVVFHTWAKGYRSINEVFYRTSAWLETWVSTGDLSCVELSQKEPPSREAAVQPSNNNNNFSWRESQKMYIIN